MNPRFSRYLLWAFWLGTTLLVGYALYHAISTGPLKTLLGAVLALFALLPAYLWCAGKVRGLPLFPVLALTYLGTFALPLIQDHPTLAAYADGDLVIAALTAAGFLALATLCWLKVVRTAVAPPRRYWGLAPGRGSGIFQFCLLLACLFRVATLSGWFASLSPSVYSLIRAVSLSLAVLASTILSYRLGRRELSSTQAAVFLVLLMVYLLATAAGLMLAPAVVTTLVAAGVFTIARGRVPLVPLAIAFVVFSVLHVGKGPMREAYWSKNRTLQPWEYPEFFGRWVALGVTRLPDSLSAERKTKEKSTSLLERASVVQMLLRVQSQSPGEKPFLYGRTYALIPELLIPRVLYSDKVRSHEGTYLLSIYYGLQTRQATNRTTIGFGLLAEAYANFGYPGVVGLALLLGAGLGWVTRWAMQTPLTSFRGLFSLVVLSLAIQTEHTAGVVVSSLFQAFVTLLAFSTLVMTTQSSLSELRLPAASPSPVEPPLRLEGTS
jgi:hypothetical protein